MANIKLELKAKHFRDADFGMCSTCAIALAYTELTGNQCGEHVYELYDRVTCVEYKHEVYGDSEFLSDKLKAESHNWDDTVIRTIELIELIES